MKNTTPTRFHTLLRTRAAAPALGLAALTLLALAPSPARAQTQDLFVSSYTGNTISRFAGTGPGTFSTTPTTLTGSPTRPRGLAFDASGDLFAAANFNSGSGQGTVVEFAAGTTSGSLGMGTVVETGLTNPDGLAFDKSGNLFVSTGVNGSNSKGSISEFASTGPGTFGPATILTDPSLNFPAGLVFDKSGALFAVNDGSGTNNRGSITRFAPGATPGTFGATTNFTDPSINLADGIAMNARGDLFVANAFGGTNNMGSITEFAFNPLTGAFGPATNINDPSLAFPFGVAVDAGGDLFAANFNGGSIGQGSITEFAFIPGLNGASGTFAAGMVVESGLTGPFGLTFSPASPVPEASTTVSLGLLLALGMGGLVVAGRRKKNKATS